MEYLFNLSAIGEKDDDGAVTVKPNLWLLTAEELPPLLFTPEDVARTLSLGRPKVYDPDQDGRAPLHQGWQLAACDRTSPGGLRRHDGRR